MRSADLADTVRVWGYLLLDSATSLPGSQSKVAWWRLVDIISSSCEFHLQVPFGKEEYEMSMTSVAMEIVT
jgi:hypothetical protein